MSGQENKQWVSKFQFSLSPLKDTCPTYHVNHRMRQQIWWSEDEHKVYMDCDLIHAFNWNDLLILKC